MIVQVLSAEKQGLYRPCAAERLKCPNSPFYSFWTEDDSGEVQMLFFYLRMGYCYSAFRLFLQSLVCKPLAFSSVPTSLASSQGSLAVLGMFSNSPQNFLQLLVLAVLNMSGSIGPLLALKKAALTFFCCFSSSSFPYGVLRILMF